MVDEFHHAAASTYRRLIDDFTSRFLLGLTAAPERTDGASLLSLCGGNLVYRCDLAEGSGAGCSRPSITTACLTGSTTRTSRGGVTVSTRRS